jgi:hypothetical protein
VWFDRIAVDVTESSSDVDGREAIGTTATNTTTNDAATDG